MPASNGWFSVRELPGIRIHVLTTDQFKTLSARLVVRLPLAADTVTANALVPFVLRRGTRRLPTAQALTRALESMYGARVSADVGKVGEVQLVEVRGEAVADRFLPGMGPGDRQLEGLLRLLLEVLYDPALEGDGFVGRYVAQEKEVLRRRIEGIINNKPQYAVYRLYEEMCRGEPFALHRLGRMEQLERLDPAQLFAHYRREVVARPAELAVVGACDPDRVAELVEKLLPQLAFPPQPQRPQPPPCQSDPPRQPAPAPLRQVTEAQDVRQEVLALGFRTAINFRSDPYPALMVYNGVLGGFPHSKLFVHVRERHSLAYFVYSRLEPTKGVMVVSAGIDPSRRQKALELIQQQLADMAEGRITDEELEATRRGSVRRLMVACDDPWALLDQWAVGVVNGLQRPPSQLIDQIQRLRREDVVEAAGAVQPDTLYVLTTPHAVAAPCPAGAPADGEGGTGARG